MTGFERVLVEKVAKLATSPMVESGIDALTLGATLLGEGRVATTVERSIPEARAALAGFRTAESLLPGAAKTTESLSNIGRLEASLSGAKPVLARAESAATTTEALISKAAQKDAPVFLPALWSGNTSVAKTFYSHMNVPTWSEISAAGASTKFLPHTALDAAAETKIAEIAAARLPLVQNAANAVADSRGLARPVIALAKDDDPLTRGSFRLGTDKISIHPKWLAEQPISQVAGTTGHEMTHYEQLHLMVRNIADEAGVGVVATPEEAAAVRAKYEQEVGIPLGKRVFNKVMAKRAGIELSPEDAERAQVLRTAVPASKGISTLQIKAEFEKRDLERLLAGTESGASANLERELRYYKYSLDKPDSAAHALMENTPPLKAIVSNLKDDEYGLPIPMTEHGLQALRRQVASVVDTALQEVESRLDMLYWAYRGSFDEFEARGIGDKIVRQVRRMELRDRN